MLNRIRTPLIGALAQPTTYRNWLTPFLFVLYCSQAVPLSTVLVLCSLTVIWDLTQIGLPGGAERTMRTVLIDVCVVGVSSSSLICGFLCHYKPNVGRPVGLICGASLLYFVIRAATPSERSVLLKVSALIALCTGIIVISRFAGEYQVWRTYRLPQLSSFKREVSLFHNGTSPGGPIAAFIALLTLVLAGITDTRRRGGRYWYFVVSAGLLTVSVFLSFSRGLYLSFIIFCVCLASIVPGMARGEKRCVGLTCLVLLATVTVGASIFGLLRPAADTLLLFGTQSQVRSAAGRVGAARIGLTVLAEHPLVGVGPGNYTLFAQALRRSQLDSAFSGQAFNAIIQIGAEQGVLGAALLIALFVSAAWSWQQCYFHPLAGNIEKQEAIVLAAGLAALLSYNLVQSALYSSQIVAGTTFCVLALLANKVSDLKDICVK